MKRVWYVHEPILICRRSINPSLMITYDSPTNCLRFAYDSLMVHLYFTYHCLYAILAEFNRSKSAVCTENPWISTVLYWPEGQYKTPRFPLFLHEIPWAHVIPPRVIAKHTGLQMFLRGIQLGAPWCPLLSLYTEFATIAYTMKHKTLFLFRISQPCWN